MAGAHGRGRLLRKPWGPDLTGCNQIPVGLSSSHLAQGPHPREAPLALCPGKGWALGHGGVGGEVRKGMGRAPSRMLCAGNLGPGHPGAPAAAGVCQPPWGHHKAATSTSS